jgi:hypothetical protein
MVAIRTPGPAASIRAALREVGFARVGPLDVDAYRALAGALGPVLREDRIAIEDGARQYVNRPDVVPFHTDHPAVEVIAWRCDAQDEHDGASLLLDARAVLVTLSPADRHALREVVLSCPGLTRTAAREPWPILRDGHDERFFFAPWLPTASTSPALDALRAAIAAAPSTARVRLGVGEAIFVDNQRVMHGRDAIAPASPRRLHRIWIGR